MNRLNVFEDCTAHEMHYTSSHNFIPGNLKVPDYSNLFLFTLCVLIVVDQMVSVMICTSVLSA